MDNSDIIYKEVLPSQNEIRYYSDGHITYRDTVGAIGVKGIVHYFQSLGIEALIVENSWGINNPNGTK